MKRNSAIVILFFLLMSTPALAFTDICEQATKAKSMTSAQMKEFFERYLEDRRIEGHGKVYDVVTRSGTSSRPNCTIIVSCGNDIFIYVDAGEYWGSKKKIEVGQKISFTGECKDIRWKFYRDSDNRNIQVKVENAYLDF